MKASHRATVAELEKRLLEETMRRESMIADHESEMRRCQDTAEERLSDVQQRAAEEKQTLLARIRLVLSSQIQLLHRKCNRLK